MSDADQREEAIFEAALKLAASERAAYLDQTCSGDTGLRRRVEVLLGAFERAGGFMNQPATPERTINSSSPTEIPGDRIGHYKLLEQIGEGGCGVVYVAEQEEPVRRRVALKIIKLGMDTKQVIARFDAERQALAMMDHPNIAKIHDAGTTDMGRPYFVMELVRGIKITDYCAEHELSPRERLDLFIQVCRAIQHAHQKGVIHRDIKPSNILVTVNDGVGVPKVIDFGIAKATQGRLTDQTVYTAFEQFIGTPAYMSPEQAVMTSLDIDTRSDVYSLGVLLYELLTGTTPFDAKELLAKGLDEMRRTIREVEPVKPSTRLTQTARSETRNPKSEENSALRTPQSPIPSDLDWIVMKCLEKDRTRRYETANGLATDIARHLSNEPISARPPSKFYEFQKTVQRHRFGFAAIAAVILALAAGLTVSTRMYWHAQAEKGNAQAEKRNAQVEKRRAEIEAAKSEQVAKFMMEMLKGAGPSVARGRDAMLLREMLDKTATRVGHELTDQPEVQGDLWFALASTYADIGDKRKAVEMCEQARKCYRQCFPQGHKKLAITLSTLGTHQSFLENVNEGKKNAALGLAMARQLNDEETLATCLSHYGYSLSPWGLATPKAVPFYQEALAISRKFGTNTTLLSMLGRLGSATTNSTEKLALYREALAIAVALKSVDSPSVASSHFGLAQALLDAGQPVEAEAELRITLDLWRKLYVPSHTYRSIVFRFFIASLVKQSKWDEVEKEFAHEQTLVTGKSEIPIRVALEIHRGNWREAIEQLEQLPEPDDAVSWSIFFAFAGRTNEFLASSRLVLEQATQANTINDAETAVKAALLLPLAEPELVLAKKLADFAAAASKPASFLPWGRMVKSLADYRAGEFDSAIEWSRRVTDDANAPGHSVRVSWMVQALAQVRQGDTEAARTAYKKGADLIAEDRENAVLKLTGIWSIRDWLISEILRREAEALLSGNAVSAGTK